MTALPVGKNDHTRPLFADNAGDFELVFPGVFHAPIGNVQGVAIACSQNSGRVISFASAIIGGSARPHLSLCQVENSGAVAALGHFEQGPAAGLLNVISMRGNGQNIECGFAHSNSPASMVTVSRTINRLPTICFTWGSTRSIWCAASTNISTKGSLPPASTSVVVLTRPRPVKPTTA